MRPIHLQRLGLFTAPVPANVVTIIENRLGPMLRVEAAHIYTGVPLMDIFKKVATTAYLQGFADRCNNPPAIEEFPV